MSGLRGTAAGVVVALALGVVASAAIALFASAAIEGAPRKDVRVYAEEVAARAGAPYVVTSADFGAAGSGTPGEALLQWWQSMQTGADVEVVLSSLAPAAGGERRALTRKLETVRYVFAQSKPRLIDSRVRGDRAQVVAVLASGGERDRDEEAHVLEIFELERVAGAWRVGHGFIERRYEAEVAFAAEAEEGGKR